MHWLLPAVYSDCLALEAFLSPHHDIAQMKVMIVDDSAAIRRTLRTMLLPAVDDFCECSDGSEALESYSRFRPDWVLMDIMMNEVNGFQATESILSSFPNARIIMITQHNDRKLFEKALHAGARECVLKDNLLVIEQIIRRSRE